MLKLNMGILMALGVVLTGCTGGGGSSSSSSWNGHYGKMQINLNGGSVSSQSRAMRQLDAQTPVQFPTNRTRCYAVNVTAPDISSTDQSCGPTVGVLQGFYASGTDQITLNAPAGSDRRLEVYMLLMPVGDTSDCPTVGASFDPSQLNNMYRIGELDGVTIVDTTASVGTGTTSSQSSDTSGDVVPAANIVSIAPVYQGASENIVNQLGLSASCMKDPSPSAFDNFTILQGANWTALSSNMLATAFDDSGMHVAGDASAAAAQWQTQQANYSIQGDFTNTATFTLNSVNGTADAGVRMVLRFDETSFIHYTVQVQGGKMRVWRAIYKNYDPDFDDTNDPVVSMDNDNFEDWGPWLTVSPGSKVQLIVSRMGGSYTFAYVLDGTSYNTFGEFADSLDLSSYNLGDSVTPMLTTYDKSTSETIDVSYSGWQVIGYIYDTSLNTIPAYFQPF